MPKSYRDDLFYATFAIAHGYELRGRHGTKLTPDTVEAYGCPADELQFYRGDVRIWMTARGWRATKLDSEGNFTKPKNSDFHKDLRKALEAGVKL